MPIDENIQVNDPIIPTHEFPEEDDMQAFWNNPINACEWMQRKYIWMTYAEYTEYWNWLVDYEWEVWPYQEIQNKEYINVYTKETKIIKILVDLPQPSPEDVIKARIQELRLKLIAWTITEAEREELKLLIG